MPQAGKKSYLTDLIQLKILKGNMIYYASKAIIYDKNNNILLGKRSITQSYEPLGGTLQGTENFEQALHREIMEEAGIEIEILGYIGSYKFQWYTNTQNHTICVLFSALTLQKPNKQSNPNEIEIIPQWINIDDIEKIPIHPLQKEFKKLLLEFV